MTLIDMVRHAFYISPSPHFPENMWLDSSIGRRADLLPALKGWEAQPSYRQFIGSPHLSAYICHLGAVRGVRTPPNISSIFRALFLMFSFPTTSLSASKPHLGHFNLLYPFSSIFESHCGYSLDVPLGSTIASGAPCLADCQSIHLSSLEYPIMISFVLWFLGSFLSASISP